MDEFDTHINIDGIIQIKDSDYYHIRDIEIEHPKLKLSTPFKILEGKNVNINNLPSFNSNLSPIFEHYAYIAHPRSWKKLYFLLEEADREKVPGLNKMVGINSNLWKKYPNTISFVFSKNPFRDDLCIKPMNYDNIYSLLDYLHSSSKLIVLSPDIVLRGGKDTIDIDEYLNFVYNCITYLSDKNNKPIFAPIQPRLSRKKLSNILNFYKEKNINNLWINLCATQIGGTYFTYIRTLIRLIEDIIGLDNVTLYYSHIKREVDSNIFENRASASDILSQFFCADFVGINREPFRMFNKDNKLEERIIKKGFKSVEEFNFINRLHKHRLFDPNSYYYYKVDYYPRKIDENYKNNLLNNNEFYKLQNGMLLSQEIENTKKYALEKGTLKKYINSKDAINKNTELFDNIISPTPHKQTILDF